METKHQMPALTEQQRDSLYDDLQYWVKTPMPGHSDQVRLAFQIALAALTAESAGNFTYHEDEDGDPTDFIVESDGFSKNSFKLYTATPVPSLKKIALPEVCAWNLCELLAKSEVIDAIRTAGYEVTE